jgi:hypothetical protein
MTSEHRERCSDAPAPSAQVDAARIAEVVAEGDGWWQSCSGCLECEDGHPNGDYPYSDAFKCQVGSGCGDCGGLGVTWHDARGLAEWCDEQAAEMSREAKAEARATAAEAQVKEMREALEDWDKADAQITSHDPEPDSVSRLNRNALKARARLEATLAATKEGA